MPSRPAIASLCQAAAPAPRADQPAHLPCYCCPQVEDPKRALLAFGNKTSQVIKDVMTDLQKLKGVSGGGAGGRRRAAAAVQGPAVQTWQRHKSKPVTRPSLLVHPPAHPHPSISPFFLQIDSVKFSRHNPELKPFEGGGEAALERHCAHQNCSLFALGSTQKKRPHNLVMGRLFDFRWARRGHGGGPRWQRAHGRATATRAAGRMGGAGWDNQHFQLGGAS